MLVVVTGQPGVGKSTVCAALAARHERAAHVEADVLHRMIVAGREWPSAGTEESVRQLVLRTATAATVARLFARAGFTTFLDEVIASAEQLAVVDETLGEARWVVLRADRDVVLHRDSGRSKHTAAAYLDVEAAVVRLVGSRATVIDSSRLSAEETVELVGRQLAAPG